MQKNSALQKVWNFKFILDFEIGQNYRKFVNQKLKFWGRYKSHGNVGEWGVEQHRHDELVVQWPGPALSLVGRCECQGPNLEGGTKIYISS